MRIEIEKVFDIADLFTPKGKSMIFPVSPVYIAEVITDSLGKVAAQHKYSVKWTGKRFGVSKGGDPLFSKDFQSKEDLRNALPELYASLGMLNRARLTCNQGQLPVASI